MAQWSQNREDASDGDFEGLIAYIMSHFGSPELIVNSKVFDINWYLILIDIVSEPKVLFDFDIFDKTLINQKNMNREKGLWE